MTVQVSDGVVVLAGDCPIEDAEPLLALLHAAPTRPVDLRQAGHLHTAIFQVLWFNAAIVQGPPADPFVADWLWPLLTIPPTPPHAAA